MRIQTWQKKFLTALLLPALLGACVSGPACAEGTLSSGTVSKQASFILLPAENVQTPSLQETASYQTSFAASDRCFGDTLAHSVSGDSGNVTKKIYDALAAEIVNGNYSVTLDLLEGCGATRKNIGDFAFGAVMAWERDYPVQSLLCTGAMSTSYSYVPDTDRVTKVTVKLSTFSTDDGASGDEPKALQAAADAFKAQYDAAGLSTDMERYRYIHDYLCEICYYHDDGAQNPKNYSNFALKKIHSAYGALVGLEADGSEKGHVVCEGYAYAFQLLCRTVGLPCFAVSGESRNASSSAFSTAPNHIWDDILIDGSWYAVDVTWDDGDYTDSDSKASYRWYRYDSYGDNSDFTGTGTARHKPDTYDGDSEGTLTWHFGTPVLASAELTEPSSWQSRLLEIITADFSAAESSYADLRLIDGTGREINPGLAPSVRFTLSGDATISQACTVPAGKAYTICGNGHRLSRANNLSGADFTVGTDSPLTLENITLQGGSSASPLISCTNGASLTLRDATVTGNTAAYAIESAGPIAVSGSCVVSDNKKNGTDANILMQSGCTFTLAGQLTAGSAIHFTKAEDGALVTLAPNVTAGDTDKSAFIQDASASTQLLEWSSSGCQLTSKGYTTTRDSGTLSVCYLENAVPTALGGSTVTLTNNGSSPVTVRVCVAYYGAGDKLTGVSMTDAVSLLANGGTGSLTLPSNSAAESAAKAKLLFLSGESAPERDAIDFAVA